MIELPEAIAWAKQLKEILKGKAVTDVFNSNSPHKFTFFTGDPLEYKKILTGRKVVTATGQGMFVDIRLDHDTTISINDGVNLRYGKEKSQIPAKYQLLITFDDDSFLVFTVAMYGSISVYKGEFDNAYYKKKCGKCTTPIG